MRILTVKQPWAAFIAAGWKAIENRTWAPPPHLMGQRIGIHAGASIPSHAEMIEILTELKPRYLADAKRLELPTTLNLWRERFEAQKGRVVCTAKISRVFTQVLTLAEREPDQVDWWVGPYAWHLTELKRASSPELKGMLGPWSLPASLKITETATETTISEVARG